MTTTVAPRSTAEPRRSALQRPVAMALAREEYARFLETLGLLAPADWRRATECTDWDVHAMAGHVLGMAEMAASLLEQARQMLPALRSDLVFIDALTALQVAKHQAETPERILARYAAVGPKAAKGRRRTPRLVRGRTLPVPQLVGAEMEDWTVGFLVDVILTRDTWMHRIDVSGVIEARPRLTSEHDGVIVADVVAEWAQRHGRPCRLTLTGPAGGEWSWGSGGPELQLDALDFCRVLSGRGTAEGLLAVQVPF
jgi:uncharacterized protein (TIGR03083 family)